MKKMFFFIYSLPQNRKQKYLENQIFSNGSYNLNNDGEIFWKGAPGRLGPFPGNGDCEDNKTTNRDVKTPMWQYRSHYT